MAPNYADLVATASSSANVIQTPPPAERLEKLEYISSEEERRRKMLQIKVTHPANSNSFSDLEEHVKQFFAQQLNMLRREVDDAISVTKLPQPNTTLIKLSNCSEPKNICTSVMTRHTILSLIAKKKTRTP